MHNSLMFNYNFESANNSLLTQLKRRENTITNMKKYLSKNMLKTVSNAILFGKLNYHLLIWPLINNNNLNKVNKIIENISRMVYGNDNYGRTFDFILKKLNWFNIQDLHEIAISKFVHKLLNGEDKHYLKDMITNNRQNRNLSENKIGPIKNNSKILQNKIGLATLELKTVIYKSYNIYNKLPREITLIKNKNNLKKWIKKYYNNKKIKFTIIKDDFKEIKDLENYEINDDNLKNCIINY